jgi:NADH:ubiquinone oxidoreductase subunit 6 (subunit J)
MQIGDALYLVGFYFFAALTVISAGIVAFSTNILRAAFGLMFSFFGVAGLYLFLHADFLAATQVLIYVGGVLVLMLFGIMLTQKLAEATIHTGRIQWVPSLIGMAILFAFILYLVFRTPWNIQGPAEFQETTAAIGTLLMTEWLLPFEVASILLLAALVGAVSIARTRKAGS